MKRKNEYTTIKPINTPAPEVINSIKNNNTQNTNTKVKIPKQNRYEYKCTFIENLKAAGVYERFISVVRTLRGQNVAGQNTLDEKKLKQISDSELLRQINTLFKDYGLVGFDAADLRKSLLSYPELGKAYLAGQSDLLILLKEAAVGLLEDNNSIENIETALKVADFELKAKIANVKMQDGVKINLNCSNETTSTLVEVLKELQNTDEPDWDTPDPEAQLWDAEQGGDQ